MLSVFKGGSGSGIKIQMGETVGTHGESTALTTRKVFSARTRSISETDSQFGFHFTESVPDCREKTEFLVRSLFMSAAIVACPSHQVPVHSPYSLH